MRSVVISSPGAGPGLHWSHAVAAELAARLAADGCDVLWFAVVRPGQLPPPPPAGCEARVSLAPALPPLHRVAVDCTDGGLEQTLQRSLREQPAEHVVHVGAGARGSPNLAWLADRMGSAAFAVVRAAEVVCHRGDLVDDRGAPCHDWLDPQRCRRCCAGGRWWLPPAEDFRSRSDLVAGSLLAARAVFVAAAAEVATLVAFGLLERSLVVADPAAIAAAVRSLGSAR